MSDPIPKDGWSDPSDEAAVKAAFPVGCEVEVVAENGIHGLGPKGTRGKVTRHIQNGVKVWGSL